MILPALLFMMLPKKVGVLTSTPVLLASIVPPFTMPPAVELPNTVASWKEIPSPAEIVPVLLMAPAKVWTNDKAMPAPPPTSFPRPPR